jgi:dihydroxyacetone kinase-like protein
MDEINISNGKTFLDHLVETIHTHAAFLSEVDGAIGDGDHGINMDKGFLKTREKLSHTEFGLSEGLGTLGNVLFDEIGGAMGPIYGTFFMELSDACAGQDILTKAMFAKMLTSATQAIQDLGGAKAGDKTLLDTLIPANAAFSQAVGSGKNFQEALLQMKTAAATGKESTRSLVAKIGRASRLGERSRGFLDAGATSCDLILQSLADSILQLLSE